MATPSLVRFLQSPRARRNALLALIWLAIVLALGLVREVLLPFIVAGALAYVIDPLVTRATTLVIKGRQVPRWAGVIAIYLAFAAVCWILAVFFVPQVYREVAGIANEGTAFVTELRDPQRLEELADQIEGLAQRMRIPVRVIVGEDDGLAPTGDVPELVDVLAGAMPADARLPEPPRVTTLFSDELPETHEAIPIHLGVLARGALDSAGAIIKEQTSNIVGRLQLVVGGVLSLFFSFFVVLMITAFLQADTDRVKRFFFSVVAVEDRAQFDEFLGRVDRGLSGVVRGQLTICLVNGVLTLVGLLVLQVKFAFILATVAMVFSLIPIFGSILSTLPIVLVGLASGPITALLAVGWIVLIHFLEANFLNPKIMGDAAKIHPVVIVLALVAGEHFYGLAGALFAVPFVSFCLTVMKSAKARVAELEAELSQAKAQVKRTAPRLRRPPRIWRS
jgi:predicted PurR-regulated permease PerM